MSVESNIVTALTSLVGGRIYPDVAPLDAAKPYITYQQVGGQVVNFLESIAPGKRNGRFQINVWAETRAQAADLSRQAEVILIEAPALLATPQAAATALYEPDTKLYGTLQFFSIWF